MICYPSWISDYLLAVDAGWQAIVIDRDLSHISAEKRLFEGKRLSPRNKNLQSLSLDAVSNAKIIRKNSE